MASIPITIQGVMTYSGLEVGGGPMPGGPGGDVGIWPSPGHPAHPIAPGGPPPGIWPSPGYPAHPIVLPPESGGTPPATDEGSWRWVYVPGAGWALVWFPAHPGKPMPPGPDQPPPETAPPVVEHH